MPSGSIRSVTLAGIPYNVAADANINNLMTEYETSRIPTSGQSMKKMMRRIAQAESVVLVLDGTDRENLRQTAEAVADIEMSYETLAGDLYTSTGSINVEGWESEDNRVTVVMQPNEGWTAYVNS